MHRVLSRLERAHEKLIATVAPLSEEVYLKRPAEAEWSVAEVVQHLDLVERRVIEVLARELTNPPRRLGLLRRLVPTSIVGSRLIKVKSPRAVRPHNPLNKEQGIAEYARTRDQLKALWQRHGEARLAATVFQHPFLGSLNGVAAVSFIGYHELRHLKQINEVLKKLSSK